jgi:murein DD-endopeptidase MepM/ murein hydrolase activator NlpD
VSWWDAPVTQGFGANGERGVDLGVSYGTPITSLESGAVSEASCGHPWGCEVGVSTSLPGVGNVIEYFLHLDALNVAPGQQVKAGQQVGISGGQLAGGNWPNSPNVSTGPHVEVGFFRDRFWGPSFDPLSTVRQGPGSGGPGDIPIVGGVISDVTGAGAGLSAIGSAIAGLPASVGHGLANALSAGQHDVAVLLQKQIVALAVAAVVLLVLFLG